MQIVSLKYGYSEINPSVFVLLYFRMIGVYVVEKFLNQKVSLEEELKRLCEIEEKKEVTEDFYDAEIYLLQTQTDYEEYKKMPKGERTITACYSGIEGINEEEIDIYYVERKDREFLQDILNSLHERNIIKYEEYHDCCKALQIYCDLNIKELVLSTKYFYVLDEEFYTSKINQYKKVIDTLKEALFSVRLENLGDDFYVHLQYSLINCSYEANLYSRRNNQPYIYMVQSLINIGNKLLDHNTSLEMSVRTLVGLVYSNLLQDENEGYSNYLQACYGNDFNSYLFLLKGQYWQNFAVDYEMANRYYFKSVQNFPEYYKAWYKIGCCLYKMKKFDKALEAFDAVRKILLQRLNDGCIKVMEIEHLFLACCQYADIIFRKYNDIKTAIRYYLYSEKVWDSIMETRFLDLIGKTEDERNKLRRIAKKNLEIEKIYDKLITLYMRIGNMDEAEVYNEKLNNLIFLISI